MKKKKRTKIIVIIVVIAVILGVIIKMAMPGSGNASEIQSFMGEGVLVQPLAKQDLSNSITATGVVQSQNVYQVTTDTTCKVKELPVALGDHVEAGDVLCVFDDTELQEQIKSLEAQMSTADKLAAKQKEISQRNLKEAKEEQTKQVNRANDAITSAQNDYDSAVKALESAESKVQSAQAEYDSAVNAVEQAKAAVEASANESVDSTEMVESGNKTSEAEKALNAAQENVYTAKSNLEQAKAEKEQAQAAVSAAKSGVDSAKDGLTDIQKSTSDSIQSIQDSIDTDALSNTGNSDSAKELAKLYRQLNEMTVTAEQAGIITKINVSKGSIPNGVLMQIEDDQNLKVNVSIKEKDILKVQTDMSANVKTDAIKDDVYNGVVSKVINFASSSADESAMGNGNSGSNYSAEIKIDPGTKLLLGMTVKVEITTNKVGEAVAVAYDSIFQEEDGTSYVYRAKEQEDGTYVVEKVKVTIGESNDYYTAIESDDLAEGDYIISLPDEVSEGETISIYNPEDTDSASYDAVE